MRLARDYGFKFGKISTGLHNDITDVPGVLVGHKTIHNGDLHTGVTAILPHNGNMFQSKVPGAVHVINGFGKSVGLMQIEEVGSIETPLVLTNTLCVGNAFNALARRAIKDNPDIGRKTSTVNPVVLECNDGWMSDLQKMAVSEADVNEAIDGATAGPMDQGCVGAGTGVTSFGFKSGIGSSSRRIKLDNVDFTIGVVAFSNFGREGHFRLPDGRYADPKGLAAPEKGSIIFVVATDIPLDARQLRRMIRRTGAGLARVGSVYGHQSGDIAVGFSTAYRINHSSDKDFLDIRMLHEDRMDELFFATADATEEAIMNSLCAAEAYTGRDNHRRPALAEWLEKNRD